MGQVERVEAIEYTDIMCSWAWGSEPKLRLLRWRYEDRCDWRLVMGGLVGDRTKNPA
jgi:protein-disulfide isomerase-like protein with CxxC motif